MCKKHDIVLLYLFGSAARGKTTPLSDTDVAFLPAKKPTLAGELELLGNFCDLFDREDIDAVNLATATPLLAHEAVSKGICLFRRSEKDRVRFEDRAQREFFDTIPLRNIQFEYLKRRILDDSFGRSRR